MSRLGVFASCVGCALLAATTGVLAEYHVLILGWRAWIIFLGIYQPILIVLGTWQWYPAIKRNARCSGRDAAYSEIVSIAEATLAARNS